jgi:VWFA-related protein
MPRMPHSPRALRLGVLLAAAAGVWVGAVQQSQQTAPPQQPVFRSGVNLVPVDVRVVDRFGKPVTDLQESEFAILENNVRQQIRHFSVIQFQPEPNVAPRPLLRTSESVALGAQSRRVFLIVLGRGRLQYPGKGVDGALELVRNHLLPQDYVGVMAWNRATDLTTDHDKVLSVLERFRKGHEKVEALLANYFIGLTAIYGGSNIPTPIQREIDTIFNGPGGPGVRQIPPGQATDAGRLGTDTRRTIDALQTQAINAANATTPLTSPSDSATAAMGMDLSLDEFVEVNAQSMQDLSTLYTGISYLRHVDGEKHLLFVSASGMMLPRAENDRSLAAAASDARVALSIIHTGGLPPAGGIDFRVPASRTIAEMTGGEFTSVQVGPQFVGRIDADSRFQYTLGYYPTNNVMDGKYRNVQVRVLRPGGLRVLYRHGYFARQFTGGFDRQQMISYSRISAAATYGGEVRDLPIQIIKAALEKTADGKLEVAMQVQIPPDRLSIKDADGRKKGSIEIAVFCADGSERLVGIAWHTSDYEMTSEAYQRFMQKGMTYNGRVAVSAQPRNVKVVVYDAGADLVGSAITKIK